MFENISKKMDLDRAFSEAVLSWDIEKVQELFAQDKELVPNIDKELVTAPGILLAAIHQKWDMFNLLYELGADLNVKTINNGWHLIHECVKNAPLNISTGIMEYCDIDSQTEDGRTPLMVAIKEKNSKLALSILEHAPSLSLEDSKGNNAGHYAAQYGMNDLFLRLIKDGLALNRKNKEGKYPADLIEDEFFKSSVPKYEVQAARELAVQEKQEEQKQDKPVKETKEVTGLSKIGKKKF